MAFSPHKGVGNFAWFPCQKCLVIAWELGGAVWQNRTWFCLSCGFAEVHKNSWRAKRMERVEKGKVCFLSVLPVDATSCLWMHQGGTGGLRQITDLALTAVNTQHTQALGGEASFFCSYFYFWKDLNKSCEVLYRRAWENEIKSNL